MARQESALWEVGLCAVLAACLLLAGCGGRGASQGQENLITGPAYPSGRQQARVLDVQVTRAETQITFTNTTARALPACTMWLNRRFGLALEPLPMGATRTLDLRDFKDEYGEAFRGGGFFATEAPDRVVLAQLDLGDELVGLIVIGGQP